MQTRSKPMRALKKLIKWLLILAVAAVVGYLAYVYMTYHRLPYTSEQHSNRKSNPAPVEETFTVLTWNLGYGAFSRDFSCFTDGGTESRARSPQHVFDNLIHCVDRIHAEAADFVLLQAVDRKSDRAWRVDEAEVVRETLGNRYQSYYVQNYNSAYLLYPPKHPVGAAKSGLLTLSDRDIFRAERISLPVDTDWHRLLDMDRCYSVCRIPTDDGRELCLFNLHFSAYTADETVPTRQLETLLDQMKSEYDGGNYVIAGGDFNMDLLGNSAEVFGVGGDCAWARPIDLSLFPEGIALVNATDAEHPVPTRRNCDTGYVPGETFVATVDGFIASDNVEVLDCYVPDEGFESSYHNPVVLKFRLNSPGPAPTPTATPEATEDPDATEEPETTEKPDTTEESETTEEPEA